LEIAPVSKPKLTIEIRNGAFSGMSLKTRVEEVVVKKNPFLFLQEMGFIFLHAHTLPLG
jgi:hypothetical protein